MENTIKKLKLAAIVNSVVSVALTVITIFTAIKVVEVERYLDKVSGLEGVNEAVILDNTPPGTEITGEDRETVVTDILADITDMKSRNLYLSAYRGGEAGAVLITNQYGESVFQMEDGNMTMYMNDNNTVYFSDKIYYGSDIDFLTLSKFAAELANDGVGTVLKIADTNETGVSADSGIDFDVVEYAIDIKGWENIEKLYSKIDASHATQFVTTLKDTIKVSQPDIDTTYGNMRLTYGYHDGEIEALGMYYYFGEDSVGDWSQCYQDWFIEGIVEVYEWSLGDDWYTYDYTKMAESDGTELSNMMQRVYDEISEMLKQFEEDKGFGEEVEITAPETDDSAGASVEIPIG